MQFKSLLSFLFLALAASAAPAPAPAPEAEADAAPAPEPTFVSFTPVSTELAESVDREGVTPNKLAKRQLGGVFYCNGLNFSGSQCWYSVLYKNECRNIGNLVILSIGPDQGTWCILYYNENCQNQATPAIGYPGGNLGAAVYRSLHCWF
ncbi:hypothetical protein ABW19_dt0200625 [Dactylella cylindrospora]|nr:hypothetical protein ABW19_dt0200625 [Dactylella cylindrospora]